MSEPAQTVATAAGAGVGAVIVAMLGVEPQALVYGACGAIVGFVLVAQIGRLKALAVFVPVVLLCAAGGTAAAAQFFSGSGVARNVIAGLLGVVFQPLLSLVVANLGDLFAEGLRRIGVKKS